MTICVKKEINYSVGLFRIGAVVLNEEETWGKDRVKPICAENDFIIDFVASGSKGVHRGKKHFEDIDEAEAYIALLVLNGFTVADL